MKAKIQYGIIKSKCIKTSEIIIDADKVTIRLNKDIPEVRKFFWTRQVRY
jgi:hypothetical protein